MYVVRLKKIRVCELCGIRADYHGFTFIDKYEDKPSGIATTYLCDKCAKEWEKVFYPKSEE